MKQTKFYRLFFIILFEIALFMLMGTVDTIMLSAYSDKAVNAVSSANQALSLANMLFTILSTGAIIIISQYIGAEKYEKANDISLVSIFLALIFGGILSLTFLILDDEILHLLNVRKVVYQDSKQYMTIILYIMAFTATNPVMGAIFRGYHKAKISLYISLVANIINVIGNAIFIFGLFGAPKLGIIGVAYSTLFSIAFRSIVSFLLIIFYLKIKPTINFFIQLKNNFFEIIKIGSPSALEGIVYNLMQFFIVSMVNLISDDALTTRTYVLTITMFIFLGSLALSQTNQIYVGNYVGGNKPEEAFKITNKTFKTALIITMSMTIIFNLFGYQLLHLFTNNPEIIKIGRQLLLFTFIVEIGRALNLVYASAFKGAGAVWFPLITAFIFMLGGAIPLTYLLAIKLGYGLIGVWIAYAFDELSRGIIAIYFWQKKKWMKKAIINQ